MELFPCMNFIVIIFMISTLTIFLSVGNNMIFSGYPQTIENNNKGDLSINQISPCSMTIETDFKLETNLNCYKDGLIVSGSGITIDLNGKTITGPGKTLEHSGIVIFGNDVTIKGPGTITNFQKGVNLINAKTIDVNSIILQNNQFGIFSLDSSYGEINENNVNSNNIGISVYSSNNLIFKNNLITDNELSGMTLVNTIQSLIEGNNVKGSGIGLFLDQPSNHNQINYNNLMYNTVDINDANGLAINFNNNNNNNNQYYQNKCMISEPAKLCLQS
jgi:parallel beta-helix repeat protein